MKSWITKIKEALRPMRKKPAMPMDILELNQKEPYVWWGNFLIEEERSRYIKIGHLIVCIDHYNHELQIACHSEIEKSSFSAKKLKIGVNLSEISILPVLPDRSLLTHLEQPMLLPPSSELTLYASTPAWIRFETEKPHLILEEFPTQSLSDSWYGYNTMMGELCYAGPNLHQKFDETVHDSTHIFTKINVLNPNRESLIIKDLRIPLPQLSVYQDTQNHLWTENVLILFEDTIPMTSILKFSAIREKEFQLLARSRHRVKRKFPRLFGL